jgi:hypothetical protein
MRNLAVAAAAALALSGCATTGKYEAKLASWVGSPADRLIASWGYPAQQMTAPNGDLVYVYSNHGSFVMPTTTTTNAQVSAYGNSAYGTATSTTYGGGVIDLSCTTYFEIGPDQRVVSWRWQGNSCKST